MDDCKQVPYIVTEVMREVVAETQDGILWADILPTIIHAMMI